MFCFHKKKKKHNALMVIAIIIAALAAAAGAYVLFTKVLKGKLCKKNAACDGCDCEEIVDETCDCACETTDCDIIEEVTAEEVIEAE